MVGGIGDEGLLHTTEIYRNFVWTILPSATLPAGNYAFIKAAKVDKTIFFLGETVEKSLIVFFMENIFLGIQGERPIFRFNVSTGVWEKDGRSKRYRGGITVIENAGKFCK